MFCWSLSGNLRIYDLMILPFNNDRFHKVRYFLRGFTLSFQGITFYSLHMKIYVEKAAIKSARIVNLKLLYNPRILRMRAVIFCLNKKNHDFFIRHLYLSIKEINLLYLINFFNLSLILFSKSGERNHQIENKKKNKYEFIYLSVYTEEFVK